MGINAGELNHRITIERRVSTQDPVTGDMVLTWQTQWENVAAKKAPLSAREFIAAQAQESQVSERFKIRRLDGLTARDRIMHVVNGVTRYYNIEGVIPDPDSGLEWVTLPVSDMDFASNESTEG